jgi:ketosteroid isomerase-like protein
MKKFCVLLLVVLVSGAFVSARAQAIQGLDTIKSQEELMRAITALDKELFDAYNGCNLDKLGTLVADDLEFYHDKTGLAVGKQPFLDAIKNNICGKVTRQLVPGTLEVYPIHGYGAVEIGVHRFHHPASSPDQDVVGEAKFVTLWQYKDGAWKITRAISYDHGIAK